MLMTLDDAFLSQARFQVTTDIVSSTVDNEVILLHIGSGSYYSLSETTLPFWEALQHQRSLAAALNEILAEYAVEPAQVLAELEKLLQDLQTYGLITPIELSAASV
jgi:hypothetical protein